MMRGGQPEAMKKIEIEGLPNAYDVDGKVWRSGQPSDSAWPLLKAAGVYGVIDLNNTGSVKDLQLKLAESVNINYFGLDWSGLLPPSQHSIYKAILLLDELTKQGITLIHCEHGSDRTGTLCACWRMQHDGWDFDDAMGEAFFSLGFQGLHEFWMAAAAAEFWDSLKREQE